MRNQTLCHLTFLEGDFSYAKTPKIHDFRQAIELVVTGETHFVKRNFPQEMLLLNNADESSHGLNVALEKFDFEFVYFLRSKRSPGLLPCIFKFCDDLFQFKKISSIALSESYA
jgi:hypothetical protein